MGLGTPIVSCNAAHDQDLIAWGGKSVENTLVIGCFHEDVLSGEIGNKFGRTCRSEAGREPQEGHYRGAEAYLLILDAIRRDGSFEPQGIREALSCPTGFEGITVQSPDNKDRQTRCRVIVSQVKNGKFVRLPMEELRPRCSHKLVEGEIAQ